ncbi:MAG: prepilin peptidase [Clostridia bacterium]|nr:prepilin peptidase [Clostridia bacterium]
MPDPKILISIFAFVFGAVFASFAGVVAYRVPKGQSIVKPDSFCPACRTPIKAYDNIPILSWLILGGKCRNCHAKIGVFSLLCEIFGGLGFFSAYWMYGNTVEELPILIALLLTVFLFLVMAAIDFETHDIYNITLILFGVIALFVALWRIFAFGESPWSFVGGAALGFGFFGLVALVSKMLLKRDALGSGDIWLVGIGGLALGAFPLLLAILIATLTGSVIELAKIKLSKQDKESEIAFGPYLLLGMGVMAIYGNAILDFYWKVVL